MGKPAKTIIFLIAGICLAHTARAQQSAPPTADNSATTTVNEKFALLIGVTAYRHSHFNNTPLKYPEDDAQGISELLEASGYTVRTVLGKQATLQNITESLRSLESQGTQDGAVLIGLFGHGVQYGDTAYFCPYDAVIRKVTDSKGRAIYDKNKKLQFEPAPDSLLEMTTVLEALSATGAGNRILFADCCREDPSAARGRAFGSSFNSSFLPPQTLALFACSNQEKAFEAEEWSHGAFTKALIEQCRRLSESGPVTSGALADSVRKQVQSIVRLKTKGRETQTVSPFSNGVVDLKLQVTTIPTIENVFPDSDISVVAGAKLSSTPEFLPIKLRPSVESASRALGHIFRNDSFLLLAAPLQDGKSAVENFPMEVAVVGRLSVAFTAMDPTALSAMLKTTDPGSFLVDKSDDLLFFGTETLVQSLLKNRQAAARCRQMLDVIANRQGFLLAARVEELRKLDPEYNLADSLSFLPSLLEVLDEGLIWIDPRAQNLTFVAVPRKGVTRTQIHTATLDTIEKLQKQTGLKADTDLEMRTVGNTLELRSSEVFKLLEHMVRKAVAEENSQTP